MPTPDKTAAVSELAEAFRGSTAAVLTEYRGLTVAQLKELRRALAADARYAVVKNTLTRIAAREAGLAELEQLLEGPSAIAFVTGDPVAVAKGIRDFARANPALVVKGGLLDGRPMSAEEIRRLADLESREVLLARLAGGLSASLSRAAAMFNAPLAQVARLAAALREQLPAGEPAPAESPAQPADEAPAEAAGVVDAGSPAEDTEPPAEPAAQAEAADTAPDEAPDA